ncbi:MULTISPECIES: hypothetical protein [Neptuniibacter]|jgi:hypothetical protein|uniref:hypothetical protein n=1 Tax=Neptuniibacter TaxID=459520 RepID=UPI000B215506|nr:MULTISPECIES: hypothetical protein [Neptuniibacter]MDO6515230.1 hypothetical protein [Neptuniibacter sp. 2_MG-2023]MDO6594997.1 hypothetical protein [Neptuniibacter sp. 1_MG-2023]
MYFHRLLILLVIMLYLVVPLVIDSWQSMDTPWFLPYIIWLAVIAIAFLIDRKRSDV